MSDHEDDRLNALVGGYMDRLNEGQRIDPEEVLIEHPDLGPAILEELRAFLDLAYVSENEDGNALGTLGDYTLRRQIGRGGMGVVYEAWQNSMDRQVALKVMPKAVAVDTRAVARFIQEAQLAGKLSHPNIVHVHGMGVEQQIPYYAMDFVEGETLAQIVAKLKEVEPEAQTVFGKKDCAGFFENIARAFADVADGLQHAHSKKVIHRDIKPSNLILDREGRLRILDFGLARLEGQESLTLSGDLVGTPQYMSPEQARRKKIPVDHHTDIYSLGATLYEMLTLQPPFRGKDHQDTLSQIIERDAAEPRKINPRVPSDLETIVLKCLRKEAVDRYGTAEALGQDLRRFVRGDAIEARPQSEAEKLARSLWRQKARIAVAALSIFALVTVWLLYDKHRSEVRVASEGKVRAAVVKLYFGPGVYTQGNTLTSLYNNMPSILTRVVDGAVGDLEAATAALSDLPEAHYHLARGLLLASRDVEALKELDRALEIDPGFAPAMFWRQTLFDLLHPVREGEARQSQETCESGWAGLWIEAHRASLQGRCRDAASAFGKLIDEERRKGSLYLGSSIEILLGRGMVWLGSGEYLQALEDFRAAEVLWPFALEPALLKGKALLLLGREDLAEEEFERSYKRGEPPDLVALMVAVLYNYALRNEPDRALAMALHWVDRMSESGVREMCRADYLSDLGRLEDAELAAERAVMLDPMDAFVQARIGLLFFQHDKLERAREHILKAYTIAPSGVFTLISLANLLRGEGKPEESLEMARKAVETDRRYSGGHLNLAIALSLLGRFEEAVAACQYAIRLDPQAYTIRRHLGQIFLGQGKFPEAVAELEKAAAAEPQNPYTAHDLGKALEGQGCFEEALSAYCRSIEALPSFKGAHQSLSALLNAKGNELDRDGKLDRLRHSIESAVRRALEQGKSDSPELLSALEWLSGAGRKGK